MADAATTVAKSRSWRPLLWGLAAFLLCPYLPVIEALVPIQQTLLLVAELTKAFANRHGSKQSNPVPEKQTKGKDRRANTA